MNIFDEAMAKELIQENGWMVRLEPEIEDWNEKQQQELSGLAFEKISEYAKTGIMDLVNADSLGLYYHLEEHIIVPVNSELASVWGAREIECDE